MCKKCSHNNIEFTLVDTEANRQVDISIPAVDLEVFVHKVNDMAIKGHEEFQKIAAIGYLSEKSARDVAKRLKWVEGRFETFKELLSKFETEIDSVDKLKQEIRRLLEMDSDAEELTDMVLSAIGD